LNALLLRAVIGATFVLALACGSDSQGAGPSATPTGVATVEGDLLKATVVTVIDGVTIDVAIDDRIHRVRYLGVEIPDGGVPQDDGISMASKALEFNRFLVEGRNVELERGSVEADLLGNLLRYVYVDGEMVNRTLLINGYATVASFPSSFQHQTAFLITEQGAKSSQRGLWSPSNDDGGGNGGPDESAIASASPAPAREESPPEPQFFSTLPAMPGSLRICDYSGTQESVIIGNVDRKTGEHVYHVPGGLFYPTIIFDEAQGDTLFCAEEAAIRAGWKRSHR